MTFVPLILDARPAFLSAARPELTLLQMPLGSRTVLSEACEELLRVGGHAPVVVHPSTAPEGYEAAIHSAAGRSLRIDALDRLDRVFERFELSDWLLLWDIRCFCEAGLALNELTRAARKTGWAQHLVALDRSRDGTREYAEVDTDGNVRRIQRFYDGVTWIQTGAVVCTLAPVAVLRRTLGQRLTCLHDLRRRLSERGAPSGDTVAPGEVSDLSDTQRYLRLAHGRAIQLCDAAGASGNGTRGDGCTIDATARIVGPVVIQDQVTIEADARIVGPAVIGRGARIGAGAVVAQGIVAPETSVAPRSESVRSILIGDFSSSPAANESAAPIERPADVFAPWTVDDSDLRRNSRYLAVKRAIETVLALLGLLALSPILLLVAIAVRLSSRGSVLFAHEREGFGGRVFRCYKFRTMIPDAHLLQRELYQQNAVDGPQFKIKRDPRVTRVGRFLRGSNLDEIPQLWNVVRGEMSLIGPRPSPFRENQICVPWRMARLSVRPGITGLWQICRRNRDGGDFHQWIYYDLLYVKHLSLWLDTKILLATVLTLGGRWSVPLAWVIREPNSRRRRRSPQNIVSYPFCRDAISS